MRAAVVWLVALLGASQTLAQAEPSTGTAAVAGGPGSQIAMLGSHLEGIDPDTRIATRLRPGDLPAARQLVQSVLELSGHGAQPLLELEQALAHMLGQLPTAVQGSRALRRPASRLPYPSSELGAGVVLHYPARGSEGVIFIAQVNPSQKTGQRLGVLGAMHPHPRHGQGGGATELVGISIARGNIEPLRSFRRPGSI